jgi:hypothetical protein
MGIDDIVCDRIRQPTTPPGAERPDVSVDYPWVSGRLLEPTDLL